MTYAAAIVNKAYQTLSSIYYQLKLSDVKRITDQVLGSKGLLRKEPRYLGYSERRTSTVQKFNFRSSAESAQSDLTLP